MIVLSVKALDCPPSLNKPREPRYLNLQLYLRPRVENFFGTSTTKMKIMDLLRESQLVLQSLSRPPCVG
jgi:hypothetical protein